MEKRNLLLWRINDCYNHESWKALAKQYTLLFARNLGTAVSYLTGERIACIVTEFPTAYSPPVDEISFFRSCFQTVPIVIYGMPDSSEALQEDFREESAVHFIPDGGLDRLVEEVASIIDGHSFLADLSVFGITMDHCTARIKKALSLMQREFLNKEISVGEIASQLNIHRCHFEREFQRYCRISPKQLIIGLKLFFACFLMKNDGMKLLHIAELAGFQDYYEFCKLFRKHIGMTPGEFRLNCESEKDFHRHFKALPAKTCNKNTTNVTL
jgi:AraC-like DNA-binding protein